MKIKRYHLLLIIFSGSIVNTAAARGVGGLIGSTIGKAVGHSAAKKVLEDDFEKLLAKTSEEINKQLPLMLNEEIRVDSMVSGPGRLVTYNNTIVTADAADINKNDFDKISPKLKSRQCANKGLEWFFKNGVTISYALRSRDGFYIGKIDVTSQDCDINAKFPSMISSVPTDAYPEIEAKVVKNHNYSYQQPYTSRDKAPLDNTSNAVPKAVYQETDANEVKNHNLSFQTPAYTSRDNSSQNNTSDSVPKEVYQEIEANAVKKWPDDYRMQAHTIEQEVKGYLKLRKLRSDYVEQQQPETAPNPKILDGYWLDRQRLKCIYIKDLKGTINKIGNIDKDNSSEQNGVRVTLYTNDENGIKAYVFFETFSTCNKQLHSISH